MADELTSWAAILLIAVVIFLTRIAGPMVMGHIEISARVERFLDAMSVSVIVALIASILAQQGAREVVAVGFCALVMARFRSGVLAIITGIGVAAIWLVVFP